MSDTIEQLTASQHMQLLIAEAVHVFATASTDPRDPAAIDAAAALREAVQAAADSGRVGDVLNILACSAAEAWTRYAMTQQGTVGEVLGAVFANWDRAEQDWRAAGLAAAES